MLVGTSRKTFIGAVARRRRRPRRSTRDDGTLATVVWALDHGAAMVRVHDVRAAPRRRSRLLDGDGAWRRSVTRRSGTTAGPVGAGSRAALLLLDHPDRLAASERPGGFARNHRKIRRQEELIWLGQHGFTHVISLLDSPHNLHAYEEAGIAYEHVPLGRHDELPRAPRATIYETHRAAGSTIPTERVLVHHEEFGDRLLGVIAGYLLYSGLVDRGPARDRRRSRSSPAVSSGSVGREIVAITVDEHIVRHRAVGRPHGRLSRWARS